MNESGSDEKRDEAKLLKAYMELTGEGEAAARSVFMYVCSPEPGADVPKAKTPDSPYEPPPAAGGKSGLGPAVLLFCFLGWGVSRASAASPAEGAPAHDVKHTELKAPATSFPFNAPLALADALELALHQNPVVLRAQKDLEAAEGISIQTRAIALPTVNIGGGYATVQRTDVDVIQAPGFTFGTPQNWSTQVKLVQSIYQGGRMLSAWRVAKLTRQRSMLDYQTAVSDTVLLVQLGYYDVLLAAQQITVQEASVELLTRELEDTRRRFDAGTLPRFNVLRAEVELANARPRLITARNNLRISKNNLANLLGVNVPREANEDIPLTLAGKLEAEPYEVDLSQALTMALERRTELKSLQKAESLRREDIVNARAGYKPALQGYVGYDAHNSILSQDLMVEDHGWIAGVQLSWNLFDGLLTQGRIKQATANYERAGIELDDRARRIQLDVRSSYSTFIEAREVLESQAKVLEEAEEALRLARARNEAGSGTQLDVLSAQTALTDARTTQAQALHDYEAARARLQRAVGLNVPSEEK